MLWHRWQLEAGMPWAPRPYILPSCVPLFRWPIALGSPWLSLPPSHPPWSWWILTAKDKRPSFHWCPSPRSWPKAKWEHSHTFPMQGSSCYPPEHTPQAFDIVYFYTDDGWWTPDRCPLSVLIAPINQALRCMFNEKSPGPYQEGKDWLHCPLCIINHVAKALKAKLAK